MRATCAPRSGALFAPKQRHDGRAPRCNVTMIVAAKASRSTAASVSPTGADEQGERITAASAAITA